jgi:hypothetical protein
MKNLNIRAFFLSILGTISCFIGCVRTDPPAPENYLKYPLEVKGTELPNGSFRLSWNAIKSADFVEYQVIKNTGDTVPYIEGDAINQLNRIGKNIELARRISDADSTFFVDSFSVPVNKTFLRVFAVLKGRNLSSKNVEMAIKTDAKELDLAPDDVLYIPEEKKLVIADPDLTNFFNTKLGIFDIATNISSINSSNPTANFFFNVTAEMTYGRFNGVTEIYFVNGSQINIRNITNLNLSSNVFTNSNNEAIFYEKTANFFFSISPQPATIRLYNRSGLAFNSTANPLATTSFEFTSNPQNQFVFRGAPNNKEVITVSTTNNIDHLLWLKFDADGRNLVRVSNINLTPTNVTKRPFAIAPDNKNFITNGRGLIFSRNLALTDSLKLPNPSSRYVDMVFSNDGTHLYAIRRATEQKERVIDVYAYPNYTFERSIPFRSIPSRVFQEADFLILVGISPNNLLRTMIEKIKL